MRDSEGDGFWRIGQLIAGSQCIANLTVHLIDLHLPGRPGKHLQGIAQGHRAQLVLRRRQWPGVENVDVTCARRTQRIPRAIHHVLHGIANVGAHVGGDIDVDDLRHQISLARSGQGADHGVTAIAHDGLFFWHGTAWVNVWRKPIGVATAVERRLGRWLGLGCTTCDEREQGKGGDVPDHV